MSALLFVFSRGIEYHAVGMQSAGQDSKIGEPSDEGIDDGLEDNARKWLVGGRQPGHGISAYGMQTLERHLGGSICR